jgi:hypothetical protein
MGIRYILRLSLAASLITAATEAAPRKLRSRPQATGPVGLRDD